MVLDFSDFPHIKSLKDHLPKNDAMKYYFKLKVLLEILLC